MECGSGSGSNRSSVGRKKPVQVNEKWFEEITDKENKKISLFMEKVGETKVKCNVCGATLELKNGSKTILTNHLKSKKHQEYSVVYFKIEAERQASVAFASDAPTTSNLPALNTAPGKF